MTEKHGSPIESLGDDRQRAGGLAKNRSQKSEDRNQKTEDWRVRGLDV